MKTLLPPRDSTTFSPIKSAKARLVEKEKVRPAYGLGLLRGLGVCLGLATALLLTSTKAHGQAPVPVIVADFNHDGIPDALILSTSSSATIAFGSVPYGTFSPVAKAVAFLPSCTSLREGSLLTGDFNGDGFADIAYFCSSAAGVLLGNGDGTFGTAKPVQGAISGTAVLGDFNKDGKLDIVLLGLTFGPNTTAIGTLQLFTGNGDGTFAASVNTKLDQTNYSAPLAADLNGDGFTDIALLSAVRGTPPSVNIFGNNQDGTFGLSAQGVSGPNTNATVDTNAAMILSGNFFGSGAVDLAVAGTAGLSVFANTSTGQSFTLNDPVTNPVQGLITAHTGSFTGSGFTDVVVTTETDLGVLVSDGKGNLAATYPALTFGHSSPYFAVADANSDGYSDIYTALNTAGALQVAANLTTGSATATSVPFSLPIGTRAIAATWPGNVNFTGSTATGSQVVMGVPSVTTLTSSKNPSLVGDTVIFTAHVAGLGANGQLPSGSLAFMDGTTLLSTAALNSTGDATFATSALTQGTHTVTANFAGDTYFAASSATVAQVVTAVLTVSSFTPNTATLGASATTVVITGTGFVSDSVVQVNGTAIQTSFSNATTLTAVIPASYLTTVGTLQITVFDPSAGVTSPAVSFTVKASVPTAILNVPSTTQPGSQPVVTLSLSHPYPVDITATVTLAFAASTTPAIDDPNIVFASTGTRTENVAIPAGATTVPPILLQAGTVAGTITVPIKLTAGGTDITPTSLQPGLIVVPAAAPAITTVTTTRSGKQFTVVMHGFSNTREMVNAKFHFTPAAGASLDTTDLTIPADAIFNTNWFQTAGSDQYGSTFTYTQIFNTSDDATTIGAVDVTLTNTVGASAMMTSK